MLVRIPTGPVRNPADGQKSMRFGERAVRVAERSRSECLDSGLDSHAPKTVVGRPIPSDSKRDADAMLPSAPRFSAANADAGSWTAVCSISAGDGSDSIGSLGKETRGQFLS